MKETMKTLTLTEVLEFAEEVKRDGAQGTVYLHEKEAAPDDTMTFGDEDAGGKVQEKIQLLLKTAGGSAYYADEFNDMEFYKEALEHIEKLKTYYPVEWVSEKELQQLSAEE